MVSRIVNGLNPGVIVDHAVWVRVVLRMGCCCLQRFFFVVMTDISTNLTNSSSEWLTKSLSFAFFKYTSSTSLYNINHKIKREFILVYTTQVNGAFRARWLASSEVNSKYYSPPSRWWDRVARQEFNFWRFFGIVKEINRVFGICVVYNKTIIHLSVCESGE